MSVKIAVCDNDGADLEYLTEKISRYLSFHQGTDIEQYSFGSSGELKRCLEGGDRFQLYLLDIMMPEIDGIRLGELIHGCDENALIIYTTSSKEYALNAFENHALRYLLKPVGEKELFSALDLALKLCKSRKPRIYPVKTGSGTVILEADRIMVAENVLRAVVCRLADGTSVRSVSIRSSFESDAAPLLEDPEFVQTHKSYLVNMRYIRSLCPDHIVMDNEKEIPISRKFYPDVRKKYLQYLERKGMTPKS